MNPELLYRIFGNQQDPRLGGEAHAAAANAGLRNAGLGMILGSRGEGYTPTFMEILAQGLMAGSQGIATSQADSLKQMNQMRMQAIAAEPVTMDSLSRMMVHAIGSGDVESARALSEVLKSMMAGSAATGGRVRPRFNTVINPDGRRMEVARDPYTGEELYRNEIADPVSRYETVNAEDPEGEFTNSVRPVRYDRITGQVQPIEGYQVPDPNRTERQSQPYSFIPSLQANLPRIAEFENNPMFLAEGVFGSPVFGALTPDQERQLYSLSIPFTEAWLRMTTGAAYNETEYRNSSRLFVPLAGDSDTVRQIKSEMRLLLIPMAKRAAGVRLEPEEERFLENRAGPYMDILQQMRVVYDAARSDGDSPREAQEKANAVLMEQAGEGAAGGAGGAGGLPDPDEWRRSRQGRQGGV